MSIFILNALLALLVSTANRVKQCGLNIIMEHNLSNDMRTLQNKLKNIDKLTLRSMAFLYKILDWMYVRMESLLFLVLLKYICHYFIYQLVMHSNTINQIWLTRHLDNLESFHFFSNKTFFFVFRSPRHCRRRGRRRWSCKVVSVWWRHWRGGWRRRQVMMVVIVWKSVVMAGRHVRREERRRRWRRGVRNLHLHVNRRGRRISKS
jgi:hypothetical protein